MSAMEKDSTEGGRKASSFNLYGHKPYSERSNITPRMREKIADTFVGALGELNVIKKLREDEDDMALVFSGASSGRNEQLILEQLDPMLEGKKAEHIYALLTDMVTKPLMPTGQPTDPHFKNIIPQALQMDSLHLDALASQPNKPRYLAICERLGPLWHAAQADDVRKSDFTVGNLAALPALLSSYRTLLSPGGVLILDADQVNKGTASTWQYVRYAFGDSELATEKFFVDNFGAEVIHLPGANGVGLVAISFPK